MTKVRTRLKKLTQDKALGPELTALTKKVEAVDAACCLTPERIPHLSVIDSMYLRMPQRKSAEALCLTACRCLN